MSERRRYPKSTCCIPGCKRWSRLFPGEWICVAHWRLLPRSWRAALRRSWERERTAYERHEADQTRGPYVSALRARQASSRLWARAKRRVIFAEAGL